MADSVNHMSIADFYAGKSVFITGGTGFLGKVFIEKLLYTCSGVNKIYILVREKHNVDAKSRIENLINEPLFSRIREEKPEVFSKLVPITGDIELPELGIRPEDVATLIEEVSIVIHSAAKIKFKEPLETVLKLNLEATKQILFLCKQLKNIQAFVHISTAYCNANKHIINEIVYPPPAESSDVNDLVKMDNSFKDPDEILPFLKGLPNTYAFSKALTESFIFENHGDVPTTIIRPSTVSASYHEPIEGWLDNWNGATGLIFFLGKGVLRVLCGKRDNLLDLVPVDYVSNLTIAAAASCSRSDKLEVYNCCTSSVNPLQMGELADEIIKYSRKHKFNDLPYPTIYFTQCKWILKVITFVTQTFPALLGDLYLRCVGKTPKFLKVQAQVIMARNLLEYFTTRSWIIDTRNTLALFHSLSPSDQKLFHFDLTGIKWSQYIGIYLSGVSSFLLKTQNVNEKRREEENKSA